MTDLKWWQRPMRIAAMQLESEEPFAVLERWAAMDFNVEQLLHVSADGWLGVYDESKRELIERYITEAHARGLRVIFYFGGHWMPERIITEHPEWPVCLTDGLPLRQISLTKDAHALYYGCPNTGYLGWAADLMRRTGQVGADGIFLDGAMFPEGTCYCPACRLQFKEQFGRDLLEARHDPAASGLIVEFRLRGIARYLKTMREALREVNPEGILYVNGDIGMGDYIKWGYTTPRMREYQDILGSEGGFVYYGPARDVDLWKASATAKLQESMAGGRPCVIFIAGDHKTWNWYHLTGPETAILYAGTVANDASPWYGLHDNRLDLLDTPGPQAAGRMNGFLAKHEAYYTATESAANIALFFSNTTNAAYATLVHATDFFAARANEGEQFRGNFTLSWKGCYEALYRCGVPFDVIAEENDLSRYQLLLAPTAACLDDATAGKLRDYVRNGGNLLATFDTSAFDEEGRPLGGMRLGDVFGVETAFEFAEMGRSSYLSLTEPQHPLFQGITQDILPAPGVALKVTPTGAQALAAFREPVPGQYRPLTPLMSPAILAHRYGKGTVVYLPGTFFERYYEDRIADYRRLVENAIRWLSTPPVVFDNLPPCVEVILRQQGDRRLLHLINYGGDGNRPLEWVAPVHDLRFTALGEFSRARALIAKRDLPVEAGNGETCATLPVLGDYEVIVLD